MIEIEIDGQKLEATAGSMVIEAADNAGIKIPRFCYHKKLSVAANCRMCLVEVEKAPKPLPACATPVTAGMKVYTQSAKAKEAQQSVMEFLLINHPLDCPICDQGGACELQDISLEYGNDFSRYEEARRTVKDENLGPLIATEMTRCIQCTRCVRFGQEIAGFRELGTIGRGDRMEIGSYLKTHAMQSELSGNVIDLCPVGALTSRPFRFTARAWELTQAQSIAPHDGIGSNIYIQTRNGTVMRVVPRENEAVNETWISDRDRFSYKGLYHEDRLQSPMVKKNGQWEETDWITAIEVVQKSLKSIPVNEIAAVASPNTTLEEYYLLQKWMQSLGSYHVDFRGREYEPGELTYGLTMPIAELENQELIVIIGSHLNHAHPLIAHRVRKAFLRGAKIICINPVDFAFAFDISQKYILSFEKILSLLSTPDLFEKEFQTATKKTILLGELALSDEHAANFKYHTKRLAQKHKAQLGYLSEGANSVGCAHLTNAFENVISGRNSIFSPNAKLPAYVLFNTEPECDLIHSSVALAALRQAQTVIAFSAFRSKALLECATVLLPMALFAENAGSYMNLEGQLQRFEAVVPCAGETKLAWKVLRVLGNFSYQTIEEVQTEIQLHLKNKTFRDTALGVEPKVNATKKRIQIIREWPMYRVDPLVRRSGPLQASMLDKTPCLKLNEKTYSKYQSSLQNISVEVKIDPKIADDCIWVPYGYAETSLVESLLT